MLLHEKRMQHLIDFNKQNNQETPYSCAIYSNKNELLALKSGNHLSPINHAEIQAIDQCAKDHPQVEWHALSLYTTGEPCCMCAAACCWANLKEVIYATSIPFMLSIWQAESLLRAEYIINHHPKKPRLIKGICEKESNSMFLDYREIFSETLKKYRDL